MAWQRVVDIVVMAVIILLHGILFWTSLLWIQRVGNTREVALDLPKSYFYMIMPVSAALIICYAALKIFTVLVAHEEHDIERDISIRSSV